eukprot:SAG11_NODE_90_length_17153_cov_63.471033_2_plen_312_part_00
MAHHQQQHSEQLEREVTSQSGSRTREQEHLLYLRARTTVLKDKFEAQGDVAKGDLDKGKAEQLGRAARLRWQLAQANICGNIAKTNKLKIKLAEQDRHGEALIKTVTRNLRQEIAKNHAELQAALFEDALHLIRKDVNLLTAMRVDLDSVVEDIDAKYAFLLFEIKARLSHRHLDIEPVDYVTCPDFASLYNILTGDRISGYVQKQLDRQLGLHAKRPKHHKQNCRANTQGKVKEVKCVDQATANRLLTSQKYFVDTRSKLLYKVSFIGEDILCMVSKIHLKTFHLAVLAQVRFGREFTVSTQDCTKASST